MRSSQQTASHRLPRAIVCVVLVLAAAFGIGFSTQLAFAKMPTAHAGVQRTHVTNTHSVAASQSATVRGGLGDQSYADIATSHSAMADALEDACTHCALPHEVMSVLCVLALVCAWLLLPRSRGGILGFRAKNVGLFSPAVTQRSESVLDRLLLFEVCRR